MPRYLTFHGHDFFLQKFFFYAPFLHTDCGLRLTLLRATKTHTQNRLGIGTWGQFPSNFYQEYKQNLFLPKTLYCYVPTKILDIPVALLLWTGFCRSLLQICYFCKLTLLVMKKPTSQFSSLCIQSRWLLDLV